MRLSNAIAKDAHGVAMAVKSRDLWVTMPYGGRLLLGRVMSLGWREDGGGTEASVIFSNGEPWPCMPVASALDIVERECGTDPWPPESP